MVSKSFIKIETKCVNGQREKTKNVLSLTSDNDLSFIAMQIINFVKIDSFRVDFTKFLSNKRESLILTLWKLLKFTLTEKNFVKSTIQ